MPCTLPVTSSFQAKRTAPRRLGLAKKQRRSSASLPRRWCTTSAGGSSGKRAFGWLASALASTCAGAGDAGAGVGVEPQALTAKKTEPASAGKRTGIMRRRLLSYHRSAARWSPAPTGSRFAFISPQPLLEFSFLTAQDRSIRPVEVGWVTRTRRPLLDIFKESRNGTIFANHGFGAPSHAGRTTHFVRNSGSGAGARAARSWLGASGLVRAGPGCA